ncbi:MAG: hypothetical protein ACYDAQ_14980, partial [Mycobacteriales bacterium]
EEYDLSDRRMVGNFPQAFSHVPLVNTARNLSAEMDARRHPQRHHRAHAHPQAPVSQEAG